MRSNFTVDRGYCKSAARDGEGGGLEACRLSHTLRQDKGKNCKAGRRDCSDNGNGEESSCLC